MIFKLRKKKVGEKNFFFLPFSDVANVPRQKLSNVANVPRQKLSNVAHLPRKKMAIIILFYFFHFPLKKLEKNGNFFFFPFSSSMLYS
jgi:hypothetical protein